MSYISVNVCTSIRVCVCIHHIGSLMIIFDFISHCRHNLISYPFSCFSVRELDVPGEIHERKTYPFEFSTVEMPYESYNGVNVRLR